MSSPPSRDISGAAALAGSFSESPSSASTAAAAAAAARTPKELLSLILAWHGSVRDFASALRVNRTWLAAGALRSAWAHDLAQRRRGDDRDPVSLPPHEPIYFSAPPDDEHFGPGRCVAMRTTDLRSSSDISACFDRLAELPSHPVWRHASNLNLDFSSSDGGRGTLTVQALQHCTNLKALQFRLCADADGVSSETVATSFAALTKAGEGRLEHLCLLSASLMPAVGALGSALRELYIGAQCDPAPLNIIVGAVAAPLRHLLSLESLRLGAVSIAQVLSVRHLSVHGRLRHFAVDYCSSKLALRALVMQPNTAESPIAQRLGDYWNQTPPLEPSDYNLPPALLTSLSVVTPSSVLSDHLFELPLRSLRTSGSNLDGWQILRRFFDQRDPQWPSMFDEIVDSNREYHDGDGWSLDEEARVRSHVMIERLRQLEEIDAEFFYPGNTVTILLNCTRLRRLVLRGPVGSLKPIFLAHNLRDLFTVTPLIEELRLIDCHLEAAAWTTFSMLPRLHTLEIDRSLDPREVLGTDQLRPLAGLPQFRHLIIHGPFALTADVLEVIAASDSWLHFDLRPRRCNKPGKVKRENTGMVDKDLEAVSRTIAHVRLKHLRVTIGVPPISYRIVMERARPLVPNDDSSSSASVSSGDQAAEVWRWQQY